MNWTVATPATKDPVDLETAKQHCRVEDEVSLDDALIGVYLKAATRWVEEYTGRDLMAKTRRVSVPGFPRRLYLPNGAPNAAIVSVKYYDTANVQQTLSSSVYTLVQFSEPGCLMRVDGQTWPSTYTRDDAVIVEYTTGVSAPTSVPHDLVSAVLLLLGHYYANREGVQTGTIAVEIPLAVKDLCAPHRLFLRTPEWA